MGGSGPPAGGSWGGQPNSNSFAGGGTGAGAGDSGSGTRTGTGTWTSSAPKKPARMPFKDTNQNLYTSRRRGRRL